MFENPKGFWETLFVLVGYTLGGLSVWALLWLLIKLAAWVNTLLPF